MHFCLLADKRGLVKAPCFLTSAVQIRSVINIRSLNYVASHNVLCRTRMMFSKLFALARYSFLQLGLKLGHSKFADTIKTPAEIQ